MGVVINYEMVVRTSDVSALADRMEKEARTRGMAVLDKGKNLRADGDRGDGIVILPARGSGTFSLLFVPYSKEAKDRMEKEYLSVVAGLTRPSERWNPYIIKLEEVKLPLVEAYDSWGKKWTMMAVTDAREHGYAYVESLDSSGPVLGFEASPIQMRKYGKLGTVKGYRVWRSVVPKKVWDAWQPGTSMLVPTYTKTQFADNKVNTHIGVVELLDILKEEYAVILVAGDDGKYWETRSENTLAKAFGATEELLDTFAGQLQPMAVAAGLDLLVGGQRVTPPVDDSKDPPSVTPDPTVKPAQRTLKEFTSRRSVPVRSHLRRRQA